MRIYTERRQKRVDILSRLVVFSKFGGCRLVIFVKNFPKIVKGFKTKLFANLRDGQRALGKELGCLRHFLLLDIFPEGHAGGV